MNRGCDTLPLAMRSSNHMDARQWQQGTKVPVKFQQLKNLLAGGMLRAIAS